MPISTQPIDDTADRRAAADAFSRAHRHSRRVGRLKLALPVLAVLGVAGFVGWSFLAMPAVEGVTADGVTMSDGKLVMANPKLDGYTSANLPYTMTAARAIQQLNNTDVIELEDIDAKLPVSADNTARVQAQRGVFDNKTNTLVIESTMTMTTSDGLVANLDTASVDMATGSLRTDKPVEIIRDGSRITAESMTASDNGKVLVFERRVRVDVEPGGTKTGSVGKEDQNGVQ